MADAVKYSLEWDKTGDRYFETGVSHGVLFVYDSETKAYGEGVVWNGLTSITESPEGADPNNLYADDIKYITLRSAEEFKGTIEAYQYPDEFEACDGAATAAPGLTFHGQGRAKFALAYQTLIGNDTDGTDKGVKLHIIYGATASPSQRQYQTVNDNPDAISFSWEIATDPIVVNGFKPVAHVEIDSTKADATKFATLLKKLYGEKPATGAEVKSSLPTPEQLIAMLKTA